MKTYGFLTALAAIAFSAAPVRAAPLHDAARQGDNAAVARLIQAGADAQAFDDSALTPLVTAALAGQADTVDWLIEHGADPSGRDGNGFTALHAAAHAGHFEIVELLVERGVDINDQQNKAGLTPLHAAAEYDFLDIAALLLAQGAETDLEEGSGWTPIMRASFRSHAVMVKLLRDHGATCLEGGDPFSDYCMTAGL